MQRNTSIGGAVVLLVVIGVIWYAAIRPAQAPITGIIMPAEGYSEHATYYDITAHYATSTPLLVTASPLADATARSAMLGFIRDTIVTFKAEGNFDTLTAEDIKMMGFDKGRKETLQIQYLIASSPDTVSYIFTIYQDTLGAHGNTTFHTFTFDKKTGATLALADLFTPEAKYLETLSSISRAQLPGIIGEGFTMTAIQDGTTPEAKNFEDFFFDNKELVILFAPYQVGPYSAGPQTLRIPLSLLSSILKAEYK